MNGKLIEEKVGRQFLDDMTPFKAALVRAARMEGREPSNAEQRASKHTQDMEEQPSIAMLWAFFCQTGKGGSAADASNYKRLGPAFGHLHPHMLNTVMLETQRDAWLAEGLAPQTVKHLLGLLRRILRCGVAHGRCVAPDSKVLRFPMPRVDNKRTECLTPEQATLLLKALDEEKNQRLASLVRFALVTGMRRGALLQLRWEDVDMRRAFITLRGEAAKKGRTDVIPLSHEAQRILESLLPQAAGRLVFGCEDGPRDRGLRSLLARLRKKSVLPPDFRPLHGLRHTYASWLASSGQVDLYTLQKLLTHENPLMTQRYAHLADATLRRAADVADSLYAAAAGTEEE